MCLLFAAVQLRELESEQCHLRIFPCIESGIGDAETPPGGVVVSIVNGTEDLQPESMAIKEARFEDLPIILPVYPAEDCPKFSALTGRLVRQDINYPLIRSWLLDCPALHETCRSQQPLKPLASNLNGIDCSSGKVVPWDGKGMYLALSYVWGASDQSIDEYPKLISDAIIFTLRAGFKYLWVDKYCINQQDPVDVSRQIGQMDCIYEHATATIVAASCSDSSEGLPGVSTVSRETQPWAISSDGTLLVSSMVPASRVIADSVWSTRGWTYQEALLSRRCLVFSKQQVYFICRTMSSSESVNHSFTPLGGFDDVHIRNTSTVIHSSIFKAIKKRENPLETTLGEHMAEFTQRDLRYEEDILRAFRGILNRQPWQSFWGVPFPTGSRWDSTDKEMDEAAFYDASADAQDNSKLSPNAAFAVGLAWDVYYQSQDRRRRRKGDFPTWCWASVLGRVTWLENHLIGRWRLQDCAQFQIGGDTGFFPLAEFITSHPDHVVLPQTSRRLLVTGNIVQLRLLRAKSAGNFFAQDFTMKTSSKVHEWNMSVCFCFDVDSEAPKSDDDLDKPFPALVLWADSRSATSFDERYKSMFYAPADIVEDFEKNDYPSDIGRTFLLLLNWDGEIAERRALIEIESKYLLDAEKERRTFKLV
ncbi:hypothetical protein DL768_006408 [Monosporascus sp. mg162]|nr:hypothetical protein DL768_006408 [Monosporascus sp. mg162]